MNISQGYHEWEIIFDKQKQIDMLKKQNMLLENKLDEFIRKINYLKIKLKKEQKLRLYNTLKNQEIKNIPTQKLKRVLKGVVKNERKN